MKRFVWSFALAALAGAGVAQGQTVYTAVLNGGQETPPVATAQTGTGIAYFDPTTKVLSYTVSVTGLTGGFSAAHIHGSSAPGVASGIVVALTGGPLNFAGSTVLSAANETALKSGLLYFNVHSNTFPGGEVRGQIAPAGTQFATRLTGAKEIPPSPGSGVGTAEITINANKTVTYSVSVSGLTSAVTAGHIHDGPVGVNGGILVTFASTGPTTFAGTSPPLTDVVLAKIRTGRTYANVHTTSFPGGEIRGQIRGTYVPYEVGCNLAGAGTFSGTGFPTPGGSVTLNISGSTPSTPGVMFIGFQAAKLPFGYGCDFLMAPPLIFPVSIGVGGAGSLTLPTSLPTTTPFPLDIQLQYFGTAPAEPGGFHTTNGLTMHVDG
jgi:Cu/Zn superoxide dismutase